MILFLVRPIEDAIAAPDLAPIFWNKAKFHLQRELPLVIPRFFRFFRGFRLLRPTLQLFRGIPIISKLLISLLY